MANVFPTILAVLIGLTFEEYYAETAMPEQSVALLLLVIPVCLLPIALAEVLLQVAARRFDQRRPIDHQRFAGVIAAAPLPVYVLVLFGIGWPKVLVPLRLEQSFLLDHLTVLLPYLVLYVGCTAESLRLRRPFRMTAAGARPARLREVRPRALEAVRQLLLVLAPLFGLLLVLDLVRDTGLRLYFQNLPLLSTGFLLGAFFAMAAGFPFVVRFVLRTRPLLEGAPLRRHLERQSARLDFSNRDILMWSTRRPILNAAIVGILPRVRYVILTVELCKQLTLDELGAVFSHEVGHAKRHHAWYYLLFSLAFFALLVPLSSGVGQVIEVGTRGEVEASLAGAVVVFLPAFALYWLTLFGFLSRRFELEADVYGAESSRDPRLFIDTLEKVARLARIKRKARASRHFSIAGRSDFLRRAFLDGDQDLLRTFQERMRRVRRAVIAVSAVVLVSAFVLLSFESLRGVGVILLELGRREQAREVLSTVVRFDGDDPVALTLLSEIELYHEKSPEVDAGRYWVRVADRAPELLRQERAAVIEVLRVGWSRLIADGRPELAGVVVERLGLMNQALVDGEPRVFDRALARDLGELALVGEALSGGDGAALEELLARSPRWLRRPDARAAREYLERWRPPPGA